MPTERPPLLGEVVPTFADRGCCVVSATDPPVVFSVFLTGAATIIYINITGFNANCLLADQERWGEGRAEHCVDGSGGIVR
jgi:hypothetical protein